MQIQVQTGGESPHSQAREREARPSQLGKRNTLHPIADLKLNFKAATLAWYRRILRNAAYTLLTMDTPTGTAHRILHGTKNGANQQSMKASRANVSISNHWKHGNGTDQQYDLVAKAQRSNTQL